MIRLLIAAHSAVVRAGLESLVSAGKGIEVVASITPAAVIDALGTHSPDVVLAEMDTAPPEGPPFVLLTDVRNGWPGAALRSAARAVLPRDAPAAEILAAVEAAAAGLVVIHPRDLVRLEPVRTPAPTSPDVLTPREIEVLRMVAEGIPNKTIAWKLAISEHTVKFHVASIMSKLQAGSRTEAVTLGIRRGLIPV